MTADPLFRVNGFLDPHDLLQARLEMAQWHLVESTTAANTEQLFGVSLLTG